MQKMTYSVPSILQLKVFTENKRNTTDPYTAELSIIVSTQIQLANKTFTEYKYCFYLLYIILIQNINNALRRYMCVYF